MGFLEQNYHVLKVACLDYYEMGYNNVPEGLKTMGIDLIVLNLCIKMPDELHVIVMLILYCNF